MKCKLEFSNEADLRDTVAIYFSGQDQFARTEIRLPDDSRIDIVLLEPQYPGVRVTTLIECKLVLDAKSIRAAHWQLVRYSRFYRKEYPQLVILGLSAKYAGRGRVACENAAARIEEAKREGEIEVIAIDECSEFYEWACLEAYIGSQKNRKRVSNPNLRRITYSAATPGVVDADHCPESLNDSIYNYYANAQVYSSMES